MDNESNHIQSIGVGRSMLCSRTHPAIVITITQ